jgi:rubredoxin
VVRGGQGRGLAQSVSLPHIAAHFDPDQFIASSNALAIPYDEHRFDMMNDGIGIQSVSEVQAKPWTCMYCGYVYEPDAGHPESGIAPGTQWENIPEDWCCPMCSADKPDFAQA